MDPVHILMDLVHGGGPDGQGVHVHVHVSLSKMFKKKKNASGCFLVQLHPSNLVNAIFCLAS